MVRALLFASVCFLAACSEKREQPWSVAAPDEATRRTTAAGVVVGGLGRYGSHAWLGVPFAAPPVGGLRWRIAQPPASWASPRQALSFAPACSQLANPLGGSAGAKPGGFIGAEDCLYLNLWAPPFTPDQVPKGGDRLPVMVWIHGGGNSMGTAAFYEPGRLAAEQKVIVVSLQYRLGPMGWFRHEALRAEQDDPAEQSGNFGTLDLIRGLTWVSENASSFGGDPGNVTIFGESAGGMDVYSLLLAPQAKGLFHRAIAQSGGLSKTTPEEAEHFIDDAVPGHKNSSNEVALRLLEKDGKAKDWPSAKAQLAAMSKAQLAKYLRDQSAAGLFAAYTSGQLMGMIDLPLVFREGSVLPKGDWTERFATSDGWNGVPVILGTNRDEAKLFLFLDPRRIWKMFGVFPRYVDEPTYQAAADAMSRTWKLTGADAPARAMRKSGASKVFVYRFDWRGQPIVGGADFSKMVGAAHAMEIPFVFGHFDLGRLAKAFFDDKGAASREELSGAMRSYWAQFARQGDPGQGLSGALPAWGAWDDASPQTPKYLLLDVAAAGGVRMSADEELREKIIADVDQDPRLPTQLDKCRVFHDLAGWTQGLTKDEYAKAGKAGCAGFPFADYPWTK